MPHRTFFAFIFPSIFAMVLFISLPIVSVAVQSLFVKHSQILVEVENSGPFGITKETKVDTAAMEALQKAKPMGGLPGSPTSLTIIIWLLMMWDKFSLTTPGYQILSAV